MADRPENHPDEKDWKPLYNDPETEMPKAEKTVAEESLAKQLKHVEAVVKAARKAEGGEADAGAPETPARREIAVPASEDKK